MDIEWNNKVEIMKRNTFWIYFIVILFLFGGLVFVFSHHHHTDDICIAENLQIYCLYAKNPFSRNSIPLLILALIFILNFYIPLFFERKILYTVNPDISKRYLILFYTNRSYRAPPR